MYNIGNYTYKIVFIYIKNKVVIVIILVKIYIKVGISIYDEILQIYSIFKDPNIIFL